MMRRILGVLSVVMLTHSALASRELHFDVDFDGGSIGSLEQISYKVINDTTDYLHYYIKTQYDPATPFSQKAWPSNRWFYFRMVGCKGCEVALDIDYNDSRRAVWSYDDREYHRFTSEESPTPNGKITKRYDRDTVFVAYYEPYGSERFSALMGRWEGSSHALRGSLGRSGEGRELDLLVVGDNLHSGLLPNIDGKISPEESDRAKSVVYIHSRIHPSETPASWHLEALVEQLLADDSYSRMTLSNTIFYIVPSINPDGVALGRSRSNAIGVNMEVNYGESGENTMAEVTSVKRLFKELDRCGMTPKLALNMHSQSAAKGCYWIHSPESTDRDYNRKQRMLAMQTTIGNPYFNWADMSYSSCKERFLEGWLYREFDGAITAVTFETPYSYYSNFPAGEWVTRDNLASMSRYNLNAINHFVAGNKVGYYIADEPYKVRSFRTVRGGDMLYFGESTLRSTHKSREITYSVTLPHGDYDIYRWRPEEMRWQSEGVIVQADKEPQNIEHIVTVKGANELLDRVIFVQQGLDIVR